MSTETGYDPVEVRLDPRSLDALAGARPRMRRALKTNTFTLTATNPTQRVLPQADSRCEAFITSAVGTPTPAAQASSATTEGSQTSPAAGTTITSQVLPAGTYTVSWSVQLGGTLAAADANNFGLYNGATLVATSLNAAAAGTYPQPVETVVIPAGGATLAIKAIALATVGAVYTAQLTQTAIPGAATAVPIISMAANQADANNQGGGAAQINGTDTTPFPVNTTDAVWVSAASGFPVTVSVLAIYEEPE